jgi:hypothetical protein
VASQAKPSQSSQSQNQLIKSSQVKSSRSHSQLVPTDRLLCLSSIKNEDLPRSSGCLASPLFHTLCCFSLPLSLSLSLSLFISISLLERSNPRTLDHPNIRTLEPFMNGAVRFCQKSKSTSPPSIPLADRSRPWPNIQDRLQQTGILGCISPPWSRTNFA